MAFFFENIQPINDVALIEEESEQEVEEEGEEVLIHLNCPICAIYELEFTNVFSNQGRGNILEIDIPYLADNWDVELTTKYDESAAKLIPREFTPSTMMIGDNTFKVAKLDAPAKFKSDYDEAHDVLLDHCANKIGQYASMDDLAQHVADKHSRFLINARDRKCALRAGCVIDNFMPIVKKVLKKYVRLGYAAERGHMVDDFKTEFTTYALIIKLLKQQLFSANTFFQYPLSEDLEHAINNIICLSQLCDLIKLTQ